MSIATPGLWAAVSGRMSVVTKCSANSKVKALRKRNRITGKFLGGTGRYAGATGSYEFSWEWVMEAEDGTIQGRAIELKGRVLPGPAGVPK